MHVIVHVCVRGCHIRGDIGARSQACQHARGYCNISIGGLNVCIRRGGNGGQGVGGSVGGTCCANQMFAQHFSVYINFIKTEFICYNFLSDSCMVHLFTNLLVYSVATCLAYSAVLRMHEISPCSNR